MGSAPPTATLICPASSGLVGELSFSQIFLSSCCHILLVPLSRANEPARDLLDDPAQAGQLDSIRSSSLGEPADLFGVLLGHSD